MVFTAQVIGAAKAGIQAKYRKQLELHLRSEVGNKFDVARDLYAIQQGGYYGTVTFDEYLRDLNQPHLSYEIAKRRVKIIHAMTVTDVPTEMYERVSMEKLRIISRLDPDGSWTNLETGESHEFKEVIPELVEKAQSMDEKDLREYVNTLLGQVGDNALVRRSYTTTEDVAQVIDQAIMLARMQIGSTHKDTEGISQDAKDGACYEVIAVNFLQDPANMVLAGHLEALRSVFDSTTTSAV